MTTRWGNLWKDRYVPKLTPKQVEKARRRAAFGRELSRRCGMRLTGSLKFRYFTYPPDAPVGLRGRLVTLTGQSLPLP